MHKALHIAAFNKHKRTLKAHSMPGSNIQHRGVRVIGNYIVASFAMAQCNLMLPCPIKTPALLPLWLVPSESLRVTPAATGTLRPSADVTPATAVVVTAETNTYIWVCKCRHTHMYSIYYLLIYIKNIVVYGLKSFFLLIGICFKFCLNFGQKHCKMVEHGKMVFLIIL